MVKELEQAEKGLLEARAEHMLRQSAVEATIIASPILNAVHAASNATGTERLGIEDVAMTVIDIVKGPSSPCSIVAMHWK